MAEPKKKKIISAETGEQVEAGSLKPTLKPAGPSKSATGLRVGAIVLWVLAIAFEVLALLTAVGKIFGSLSSTMRIVLMIVFLVLDLAALIAGSMLWKKANRIRPASEKNKLKFWLWNNLGVIVAAFAFIPFIILVLLNKDTDKKTKTFATVVAVIALLIGGLASYDFNPISQEQLAAAESAITNDVYWSPHGHVYHTHDDCQSLDRTEELTYGTVAQAVEAGRERLCAFCAKRDAIDTTGILTDGDVETAELADYESTPDSVEADEGE